VDGDDELDIERNEYESARLRSGMFTLWSPERKLRWCAYLLLSISLLAPAVSLLPEPVRTTYLGDAPLFTPLSVSFLATVSVVTVSGGALGLFWVIKKKTETDEIDVDLAWTLVSIEDISSGFSLVTGLVGTGACLAFVLSGFRGVEFLESLDESGVRPYEADTAFGLPVVYVSAFALVAGLSVVALSAYASGLGDG